MASNSKLSDAEKTMRKGWIAQLPANSTIATSPCGVTILAVPDGNITRFFSSVSSVDERKIRRKVGEYWALARWRYSLGGLGGLGGFFLSGLWTAEEVLQELGYLDFDLAE